MTIENATSIVVRQGVGGSAQPATTGQAPRTTTNADLQKAAQDLREAIQKNVSQELIRARAQAAAEAALAQSGSPTPAPFPAQPGGILIRRPDGQPMVSVNPGSFDNAIPPQVVDISIAFFITVAAIIIGLPLARAFARRMDRKGSGGQVPADITNQLGHLSQAVDAIALEVERISEGQRFTARLLAEQREAAGPTLPSGR